MEEGNIEDCKSQLQGVDFRRRSLRGYYHWLIQELGLGNWELLTFSPVLGMYIPATVPTAILRLQPWQNNVLRRSGWYTWLNPIKASIWTSKILVGMGGEMLILQLPKTSCICGFSCWLKLPPTILLWFTSFFSCSLSFVYGGQFIKQHCVPYGGERNSPLLISLNRRRQESKCIYEIACSFHYSSAVFRG